MLKLPIGIQSFEDLRRNGYVYIDKTMYIDQLVNSGKVYFLRRPRRFGKSLFLTTLEAYFLGQKELFHGLKIEDTESVKPLEEQWIRYPVIKFSLSGGEFQSQDGLANRLRYILDAFEKSCGIEHLENLDLPTQFQHCIEEAYRITGRQVVVLVDEYDKPLLETMNVDEAQEQRNRLLFKGFFSVLKDEDSYLRFVFVTGVTKFSKVSIFSDLNQLEDISLTQQYSGICGITEDEMRNNLSENIHNFAFKNEMSFEECLTELARMYDGYHFAAEAEGVYNPFSLFNALKQERFGSFWFSTGTPTFLIHTLSASRFKPVDFNNGVKATEKAIEDYRTDNPDPVPLFYQSGYLTIVGYDKRFRQYQLAFPNQEVRNGFVDSIFPYYFNQDTSEGVFEIDRFVYDLDHGNVDGFMTRLQSILAAINYPEGVKPYSEHDFQSNLFIIFCMLGEVVHTEVHTSKGRTDCEVIDGNLINIFEFKVDQSADAALMQIEEQQYARKYGASGKTIYMIGVDFSTEDRTIKEWKWVK